MRALIQPVKFKVDDIGYVQHDRAVIVGELATLINSSGKTVNTQFVIVLTISGDEIKRFQSILLNKKLS